MTDSTATPTHNGLAAPIAPSTAAEDDNPYVGAHPFQSHQSDRYFGRDREAQELLAIVVTDRLTLFYAESGAGKSSLINTRLRPGLQAKGFEVLPVCRVGLKGDVPPGANPYIYNLFNSLLQQDAGVGTHAPGDLNLKDFLPRFIFNDEQYVYVPANSTDGATFVVASRDALGTTGMPPAVDLQAERQSARDGIIPRVLIIDQFEEILTAYPRSNHQAGFFDQLTEAMRQDPYLWVILTLREDYVAGLDPFAHRTLNGLRTRYYMQRMGVQAALEAVKLPAEKIGHRPFAEGVAEIVVDILCKSQADQENIPGALSDVCETIDPFQLQVVCRELWQRLATPSNALEAVDDHAAAITRADLDRAAGKDGLSVFVNRALGNHYEQAIRAVVDKTGVSERELRDWFSTKLITPEGTRGLWYQGGNVPVVSGANADPELPTEAIDLLTQQFLIRPERRGVGTWYELMHDRFIQPILQANKEWRQGQNDLVTKATREWEENGRNDAWLLQRDLLEVAQKYALNNPRNLGQPEREFLEASQARCDREDKHRAEERARERGQWLTWLVILLVVIAGVAVVAAMLAVRANKASFEASKNERIALSSKWSALSALESDTDHRLLLAREALTVALQAKEAVPEAEGALLQALAQADQGRRSANLSAINVMAIGPDTDGRWLVEASADGAVRLKDLSATALITSPKIILTGPKAPFIVKAAAFSPDGHWLVTAGDDATARLWDLTSVDPDTHNLSPTLATVLTGHKDGINAVAFSPDTHWLATASDDGRARLWDLTARDPSAHSIELVSDASPVTAIAISPDGHWLATAHNNDAANVWTARLWRLSAANPVAGSLVLRGHTDVITALTFSRDAHWLVTASNDAKARLWNLTATDPAAHPIPLTGHGKSINAVAVSPDNHWLATASSDKTARLWDLTATDPATGSIEFKGHTGGITAIGFSRDGHWLVTGSSDTTARRWDLTSLKADARVKPVVLKGHFKRINALALGVRWLITAGDDGQDLLWDTSHWGKSYRELINLACEKARQNLNPDDSQSLFGDTDHINMCPGKPQASKEQVVNQ